MSTAFERNKKLISSMTSGIPVVNIRDGRTGKLNSDGSVNSNLTAGLTHPYIWVRPGGSRQEVRAININVNNQTPNLPVRVGFDRIYNEMVVMSIDAPATISAYGDATATLNTVVKAGGISNELIPAYNIEPGQVYIETGVVLKARSFPYIASDGTEKVWDSSETVDLSGDIPGSANEHVLTRISLNPDPDNPALVSTVGTAKSNISLFQRSEVASISIPAGHISLLVVRLVNGDTGLTLDRFWDWRFLASEGVEQGNTLRTAKQIISTTDTIAADTEYRVSKLTITGGGSLAIKGLLIVSGG